MNIKKKLQLEKEKFSDGVKKLMDSFHSETGVHVTGISIVTHKHYKEVESTYIYNIKTNLENG